jgi:fatty acid desaturase
MTRPSHASRWLRYGADRRSVAFAAAHLGMALAVYHFAPRGVVAAFCIVVLSLSSFIQLISAHNALHSPVFVNRAANRAWQAVLSLTFTYPASVMVPVHNLSHHLHLQTPKDVLRTTDVRHRSNLVNLLHHVAMGTAHIHVLHAAYALSMRTRRPRWFAQVGLELATVAFVAAPLAWFDLRAFLLFWLLPSVLGQSSIIGLGYLQHDGCDPDSELDHSRNFLSPMLNYLIFDNGYHAVHHMKPGLHWSLGRGAHEELVASRAAPSLQERSLFRYLLRAFLVPGERVRADGRPVAFDANDRPARRELWVPQSATTVGASSGAVEG